MSGLLYSILSTTGGESVRALTTPETCGSQGGLRDVSGLLYSVLSTFPTTGESPSGPREGRAERRKVDEEETKEREGTGRAPVLRLEEVPRKIREKREMLERTHWSKRVD